MQKVSVYVVPPRPRFEVNEEDLREIVQKHTDAALKRGGVISSASVTLTLILALVVKSEFRELPAAVAPAGTVAMLVVGATIVSAIITISRLPSLKSQKVTVESLIGELREKASKSSVENLVVVSNKTGSGIEESN